MNQNPTIKGMRIWIRPSAGGDNLLKQLLLTPTLKDIKFTHACVDTSLHPELSIADNWLMLIDSSLMQSSTKDKEFYLAQFLQERNLLQLSSWLAGLHRRPHELSTQERLIASLCLALIHRVPLTLIELPEIPMDNHCRAQIVKALTTEAHHRLLFISLPAQHQWELKAPTASHPSELIGSKPYAA